ncbi:hypothetical protein EYZ11_003208 [Aspergillus tanneri]|uniref:DUF7729 domain-containing protein n=1 Tax=Aspergillus tanneri TaxID=1220188 RepID=A0A4S3JR13_9EURO|nr:uncharacterized protein ATNIH1004_010326 [Aspergillus tanneri]KAA8643557.1 hypothetical protein ATNIH1004_010326 [Aspergillus tanneri]THC97317.1 hypothetical protein EYZ11_003208 [Aspergillus tanneri]
MAPSIRVSATRPSSTPTITPRFSLFLSILLVLPSIVVALALPPVARSELDDTISHLLSGEIVGDDLQDVSHSPPQKRARQDQEILDVVLEIDPSINSRAASLPILIASADHNDLLEDEEEDQPSSPIRRSTDQSIPTPMPFDTNTGSNFTSETCERFVDDFLSNSTFTSCHAISMLMRNSYSFFQTVRSATATSHVLDLACGADFNKCSAYMADLATRLRKKDACGVDYAAGNNIVQQAYTNMIAYEPIYRATCLKNPSTSDYCFVDAATNTSNSADYNVYFLPFGSPISGKPYPTCNACLQASMDVFAQWAQKDGQPLVNSYLPSAKAINSQCGANFASVNVTVGVDKAASSGASWTTVQPDLSLQYIIALTMGVIYLGFF